MKRNFSSVILVLIIVLLNGIAFADFDSTSANITHQYFPVRKWDWFKYVGYGDMTGETETFEFLGTEFVNSVNCLKLEIKLEGDVATAWIAQDTDGNIWFLKIIISEGVFTLGSGISNPFFYAEPKVGDILSQIFPESAGTYSELTEVGVDVNLSTGLGPYENCIEITSYFEYEFEALEYFCPGIGLVKSIFLDEGPPESGRELSEFGNDEPSGEAEIIGSWSSGIWYWDVAGSEWTKMTSTSPTGEIAAGDFNCDGKEDVTSIWDNGLWYQDGATLDWNKVSNTASTQVTAGDVTGDDCDEIIGNWSNGIWYYDFSAAKWTQMTASKPTGEIAAGDFNCDGKAEVASIWRNGLWFQDGATLVWTKVSNTAPTQVTTGDVTGDGCDEIIGIWPGGIYYQDMAKSEWTKMWSSVPSGDIAAGDFTGDGKADVASCWDSGLWYQDSATLDWTKVSNTAPNQLTAGDITGD